MEFEDYAVIGGTIYAISVIISLGEMYWLTVRKKAESFVHAYAQPFKNFVFVAVVTSVIPLLGTMGFALLGSKLAPFSLGDSWWVWPVGLLVFEFWYWLHHYLGHKVRLLWCIHAPHHAPDTLTSLIGLGRSLAELPYLSFSLGFMPAICGVPLEVIFVISVFDGFWGKFLHISPKLVTGTYGPLERFMQTPRYHRVHHAKNVLYMDTNYTSITLFWDWALGTLQPLRDNVPADYGVTREVDSQSWWDVQTSEAVALWRDVKHAPGIKNKLLYMVMPPGWSHTGDHKTVSALRKQHALPVGS